MPQYGLSAAPAVIAFLNREPWLHREIEQFIQTGAPVFVDVAGPPEGKDLVSSLENRRKELRLPVVRLRLRMVRNHLTEQLGVEVTCSGEHLDRMIDWARSAALRRPMAATCTLK